MMDPIGYLAFGITVLDKLATTAPTKIFSDFLATVTNGEKTNCTDCVGSLGFFKFDHIN